MPCEVVLSDLDGVIRHFDPTHRDRCEDRYGLERGALWSAAFSTPLSEQVITGEMTHADWTAEVGRRVGSIEAVEEWFAHRGWICDEMMALIDQLRADGTTVAVLTNGTDLVEQDLAESGVVDRVDRVFNSWHIGAAKPDVRAFEHVVAELDVDPATVFFTDDTASKFAGAKQLGMTTHHFTGVPALRRALVDAGFELG